MERDEHMGGVKRKYRGIYMCSREKGVNAWRWVKRPNPVCLLTFRGICLGSRGVY